MSLSHKLQNRQLRKQRVRSKVTGTAERPRMAVFRSLQHISVQLIDDSAGKTVAAASTKELEKGKKSAAPNVESAKKLGALIAKKAKDAKISTVVFDRAGYKYHGRVKELAEAAREGGLEF